MTYACMECGEGLPQYKAGYCARCIADEEALEYEAEDADEGREECESVVIPVIPGDAEADSIVDKLILKANSDKLNAKLPSMAEPDRMMHEGREYYRLADGVELMETDRHTFERALFGPIQWPRRQGQGNSAIMALGDEYWRPVETFTESVKEIGIPKDLAKLVLAELSPQWHTKAVRELLRTIEEQL